MTGPPAVAQLFLLTAAAFAARRFFMRVAEAPTASASMVMAIGIFGLAALRQMPDVSPAVIGPLTIGLLVVWMFIAASYVASWREGTFEKHVGPPIGRFAIGSWVAATAVLLRLILLEIPEWRPLAMLLGIVAVGVWLWFLAVAAKGFRVVAGSSSRTLVPSVVLLSTVSTQSLAIAAFDLLPERMSLRWAAVGLIVLGALFYLVGVVVVARSHLKAARWTLADDWDNTNCILHGAMSITGLAIVIWDAASPAVVLVLWLYVLCAFVAVESVELARLSARIRAYGWRRGVFSYHVTQWSRNFTFGMFYAFTLALSHQGGHAAGLPWVEAIQTSILSYGPYAILFLLVVELALYVDHRLDRRAAVSAVRRLDPRGLIGRRNSIHRD